MFNHHPRALRRIRRKAHIFMHREVGPNLISFVPVFLLAFSTLAHAQAAGNDPFTTTGGTFKSIITGQLAQYITVSCAGLFGIGMMMSKNADHKGNLMNVAVGGTVALTAQNVLSYIWGV